MASAWLEVVGGSRSNLSLEWGKWAGPATAKIPTGASVVLHATDDSGRSAQTVPFGYLTTTPWAQDTARRTAERLEQPDRTDPIRSHVRQPPHSEPSDRHPITNHQIDRGRSTTRRTPPRRQLDSSS